MNITIAACIVTALVVSGSAYKIHDWRVDSLKKSWDEQKVLDIDAAKAEVKKVCDENNQTTMEKARELQTRFDSTNERYSRLLKYGTACKNQPAASGTSRRSNEAPSSDMSFVQVPVVDGLDAGKLNDDQASQFIILQDLVAGIYCRNGQGNLLPREYNCKED